MFHFLIRIVFRRKDIIKYFYKLDIKNNLSLKTTEIFF